MSDYASRRLMMVDTQVRPSDVTKFPIIDAMLKVERENYVPEGQRDAAYADREVILAPKRVVTEPRTFAKMLDALNIQPDELVLNIGCGLGYSAAVLARLSDAVVAVEEIDGMADEAQSMLSSAGVDNAAVIAGPLTEGAGKHGPYDVILIEGGIETLSDALTEQLAEGGRIAAIFMQGALGVMRVGHKADGKIAWRDSFNATAPVLPGFEAQSGFSL
ncbi:MAG: protein-L-isoaspartate O-methyltransferase family protein [Halocynthiibacter sp.]